MTLRTFTCALILAVSALSLNAATITATLPEFNGPFNPTGPYPGAPLNVGTFTFVIPVGQQITSATLTGTFGNSQFSNTAGVDLRGAGILFGSCVALAACGHQSRRHTVLLCLPVGKPQHVERRNPSPHGNGKRVEISCVWASRH